MQVPSFQFEDRLVTVLDLDTALVRLMILDTRLGSVVELRFFGGFSVEETARILSVSPRTVNEDWRKARAFLYSALGQNNIP